MPLNRGEGEKGGGGGGGGGQTKRKQKPRCFNAERERERERRRSVMPPLPPSSSASVALSPSLPFSPARASSSLASPRTHATSPYRIRGEAYRTYVRVHVCKCVPDCPFGRERGKRRGGTTTPPMHDGRSCSGGERAQTCTGHSHARAPPSPRARPRSCGSALPPVGRGGST